MSPLLFYICCLSSLILNISVQYFITFSLQHWHYTPVYMSCFGEKQKLIFKNISQTLLVSLKLLKRSWMCHFKVNHPGSNGTTIGLCVCEMTHIKLDRLCHCTWWESIKELTKQVEVSELALTSRSGHVKRLVEYLNNIQYRAGTGTEIKHTHPLMK